MLTTVEPFLFKREEILLMSKFLVSYEKKILMVAVIKGPVLANGFASLWCFSFKNMITKHKDETSGFAVRNENKIKGPRVI